MRLLSVAYIGSNRNSERNLLHGLTTGTWGTPDGAPALDPDSRFLLLANRFNGGSPRTDLPSFQKGTVDAVLCSITTPPYQGRSLHWGDEQSAGHVLYPQRFGIEALASVTALAVTDPALPTGTADAIRRSGIQRGYLMPVPTTPQDIDSLLLRFQVNPTAVAATAPGIDLLLTQAQGQGRQTRGAGRLADPVRRRATEQYAVQRAIAYLISIGATDIRELGAPYDLEATLMGQVIHVEVKGTSGAGGTVELTRNEVHHHQNRPDGMLIVVSDIRYDAAATQPCSGGRLRAYHNWAPQPQHLAPTRYDYLVPTASTHDQDLSS